MKCIVTGRVMAVAKGQGAALQPPFNVTEDAAVEEVRDFIQRALAAQEPSDLHLPPKLSTETTPDGRYVISLSLRRLPRIRQLEAGTLLRPALVVRRITEGIWEIDFE